MGSRTKETEVAGSVRDPRFFLPPEGGGRDGRVPRRPPAAGTTAGRSDAGPGADRRRM